MGWGGMGSAEGGGEGKLALGGEQVLGTVVRSESQPPSQA